MRWASKHSIQSLLPKHINKSECTSNEKDSTIRIVRSKYNFDDGWEKHTLPRNKRRKRQSITKKNESLLGNNNKQILCLVNLKVYRLYSFLSPFEWHNFFFFFDWLKFVLDVLSWIFSVVQKLITIGMWEDIPCLGALLWGEKKYRTRLFKAIVPRISWKQLKFLH